MLGELLSDRASRIAEFKRRNSRFMTRTVPDNQLESLKADGWEFVRQNKSGPKVRKPKPIDELLENDFWCLLYHFGYKKLNSGRQFQIEITQQGGKPVKKQIDVFACDDETLVIAECKAAASRRKWPLQKDLGEFEANKGPIARAVGKAFGEPLKHKIIWAFVTKNVDWSTNDLARAAEFNIRVITEHEMRYFSEVAKHLGPAGRFQFHAEYLARTKIAALQDVKVPAVRTKIGGTLAYFFVVPPRRLLPIAFVNHRDLRDPEASPSYQRLIKRPRLRSIAKFIKNDGYFANALLVNFKEKVRFDRAAPESEDGTTLGHLTLPNLYKSMWIIDGQHRLYAFAEYEQDDPRHQIPVVAFDNLAGC
jgi:DNA sulfur modification protein DndB